MKSYLASVAGIIALVVWVSPCAAQVPGGSATGGGVPSGGNHMGRDTMSQEQFNKLQDYADQAKRLTKEDKAKGKTLEQVLAEDKVAVEAMVKVMPLSCEVTAAMQIAEGPETVNGKTINTKTYEAACANGLGYFLVSQEPEKPYGFSCFAADATRQADVAEGRKPSTVCQLPANADMKAMGTQLLAKAGTACTVNKYRYVGQNTANHTEFDEFACTDGKGYITVSALPGANIPVHVETCPQSAARGLPCKFSDNGAPVLTLQTFHDVLAQHNVTCDATDKGMRVVGQDTKTKRYVVECALPPKGLVAYVPLAGNPAPFETMDCQTAKTKHNVMCMMNKPN